MNKPYCCCCFVTLVVDVGSVDVAVGNVTVASAANVAGEVKLTLFVPLPDASNISTAAALAPFLTLILELNTGVDVCVITPLNVGVPLNVPLNAAPLIVGVVNVLLVSVCVLVN